MGLSIRSSIIASTAVALASATPAFAAAGGPEIAYALTSGQTQSIYLANPAGTGTVKLYTTASKVGISEIDIRPGGNQMAIIENSIAGGQGILKIINYSDAGVRQSVTTVNSGSCVVNGVDYHPTDGSLLVSRHCAGSTSEVIRYAGGAYASTPIVSYSGDFFGGKVRWVNDGSGFLWAVDDPTGGGRIDHYDAGNTGAPVTVWSSGSNSTPNSFDVQRCGLAPSCDKMLVTTSNGEIHLVSFSGGGSDFGTVYTSAWNDAHYSPDNLHILWAHQVQGNSSIMLDNKVFVKGVGSKDWRK